MHFVGLDVSKQLTSVCVLDARGVPAEEGVVPTDPKAIVGFLRGKRRRYGLVGLEAGSMSDWLSDELKGRGLPSVCIETRHAHKVLTARRNKTDRNDARGIAELMWSGNFREVHGKSIESRHTRAILTARNVLVRRRVNIESAIRGLLSQAGLKVGIRQPGSYERRVRDLTRREPFWAAIVEPLLAVRAVIVQQVDALTQQATKAARQDPICRRLMTAPCVGPMTALLFKATVDDPARFPRTRNVAAHLGLTPRTHQSGEADRRGRITRWGDDALRSSLFMAGRSVVFLMARSCGLKRWGVGIAAKRGKSKAAVAVARRLAVILLRMWKDQTDFQWETASA